MKIIDIQFSRRVCVARVRGTDTSAVGDCVNDAVGALLVQHPDDFDVCVTVPAEDVCAVSADEVVASATDVNADAEPAGGVPAHPALADRPSSAAQHRRWTPLQLRCAHAAAE